MSTPRFTSAGINVAILVIQGSASLQTFWSGSYKIHNSPDRGLLAHSIKSFASSPTSHLQSQDHLMQTGEGYTCDHPAPPVFMRASILAPAIHICDTATPSRSSTRAGINFSPATIPRKLMPPSPLELNFPSRANPS